MGGAFEIGLAPAVPFVCSIPALPQEARGDSVIDSGSDSQLGFVAGMIYNRVEQGNKTVHEIRIDSYS